MEADFTAEMGANLDAGEFVDSMAKEIKDSCSGK